MMPVPWVQRALLGSPGAHALHHLRKTAVSGARQVFSTVEHSSQPLRLLALTPGATQLLAHYFAASLQPGDAYLLSGEVGAGKSHFSRAFVQAALHDDALPVPSPTFLLQNTYDTGEYSPPVHHYDLYRLTKPEELARLDLQMVLPQAVSLIEWAERMGSLAPHHRLDIRISIVDDAQREALLAAISAKGLRSKVGEIADVEGEELEAYDDVRWRLIELLPHGARWEGIVGALRGHVTARGADFGLAVAPKIA